jgi:hypothetical protein
LQIELDAFGIMCLFESHWSFVFEVRPMMYVVIKFAAAWLAMKAALLGMTAVTNTLGFAASKIKGTEFQSFGDWEKEEAAKKLAESKAELNAR